MANLSLLSHDLPPPMRIAVIVEYAAGGTHNVAGPLVEEFRRLGHSVEYIQCFKGTTLEGVDRTLDDFDVAHFWNAASRRHFDLDLGCANIMTLHHVLITNLSWYLKIINEFTPDLIHVIDPFLQRLLGMYEHYNVRRIPQAFDHAPWKEMPYPQEFTIGCLGAPHAKRFEVVERIAERLDVRSNIVKSVDSSVAWRTQEEMLQFYGSLSVYVVASFHDGGPLPAQEAMLCGRPVVTTPVGMMPQVVTDGVHGRFFDGTIEDGVAKVQWVRERFDHIALNVARHTRLPTVKEVAGQYITMYQEAMDAC